MGFSIHVPLWSGVLKIKSADRLRSRERQHEVPALRVLSIWLVWQSKSGDKRPSPGA